MDNEAVQNIAVVVGLIVAFSLALTQAMGGLLTYLVEAVKATGLIKDGWSGVVAIVCGILMGTALAALADGMAVEPYGLRIMLLVGAFAGALMAAGSIKTFKAMGSVNTSAAYSEGLAHGETMANTRTALRAEPQDFGSGYAAGYTEATRATPLHPLETFGYDEVDPAENFEPDHASWQTTVDELGKVDQITDEEHEAFAAAASASTESQDELVHTGAESTQPA